MAGNSDLIAQLCWATVPYAIFADVEKLIILTILPISLPSVRLQMNFKTLAAFRAIERVADKVLILTRRVLEI
jgi:hypothetical protein